MSDLRYLVRTTCLLESRSEQYGAYLERALGPEHAEWVGEWAAEEAHHGAVLREWLDAHDPEFDFAERFARLEALPYHADAAADRAPAEELLSRCVVEALAAGFYRALRDATDDDSLKRVCGRLMSDEARHFKGFRRRLEALPELSSAAKIRVIAQRVRELDDDQIVFASHCANHDGAYSHRTAHARYMGRVYAIYRREHLAFVQSMIFTALGGRPSRRASRAISRVLAGVISAKRARLSWVGA
ncbi:MAG: ferritin-like domain-containing protein [Proteobacteria bacterium]|nr:ferritin-like domain-containing protein [Pseudomonadota bacterium]